MANNKVNVRIAPGVRLDAAWVTSKTCVTKDWTPVSPTLAKKLVGLEYQGRPKFEFEEDPSDDDGSEDEDTSAA